MCAHPGKTIRKTHLAAMATTAAYRPRQDLVFCHWPPPLWSRAASPYSWAPACCQPNYFTMLCCHMPGARPSSQCSTCQQPGPLNYQCTSSYLLYSNNNMCACNWSLSLHKHLQLASRAKCVHTTTSSGHHHCLQWSLTVGPGGIAEKPKSLCSHHGHPVTLTKNHTIINAMDQMAWV